MLYLTYVWFTIVAFFLATILWFSEDLFYWFFTLEAKDKVPVITGLLVSFGAIMTTFISGLFNMDIKNKERQNKTHELVTNVKIKVILSCIESLEKTNDGIMILENSISMNTSFGQGDDLIYSSNFIDDLEFVMKPLFISIRLYQSPGNRIFYVISDQGKILQGLFKEFETLYVSAKEGRFVSDEEITKITKPLRKTIDLVLIELAHSLTM